MYNEFDKNGTVLSIALYTASLMHILVSEIVRIPSLKNRMHNLPRQ